jgi:hypothetical protein
LFHYLKVNGNIAKGYYIHRSIKFEMKFDFFLMINGTIAGQGLDEVGHFVIDGAYKLLKNDKASSKDDYTFNFTKHYIGQHDVNYHGKTSHDEAYFFLDGKWKINTISDRFHIKVERQVEINNKQPSHVMLSYQWNNQGLVKQIADGLRKNNVPIWFDIAGDMKGNINSAMANGVENAMIVVSFITVAYSKSINCQKELCYAYKLKKQILPVFLEDNDDAYNESWLQPIIFGLEKVKFIQFEADFESLLSRIHKIIADNH